MGKLNSQEISGACLLNPDNLRLEFIPCQKDRHGLIGRVVRIGGAAGVQEVDAVHLAPEGRCAATVPHGQ